LVAFFIQFIEVRVISADARMVNERCGVEDVKGILNMSTGDWSIRRQGPDCTAVAVKLEGEAAPDEFGDQEEEAVELWDV
jgi:hypothetical protein